MSEPTLRLEGVRRRFVQGETVIEVLQGVDLRLEPGTLTAMVGPSGAGKSTLLHIIGLLEPATSGEVWIQGKRCGGLGDRERTRLRREQIGFVYQFHHLLPDFTAQENVMMPRLLAGEGRFAAASRALELLQRMGLEPRLHHRPGKLSGGEQQRVAIARALANRPSLILADEPTGNLDPHTSEHVVGALIEIVRSSGAAALVATHNLDLAAKMDAVYRMSEGVLRRV